MTRVVTVYGARCGDCGREYGEGMYSEEEATRVLLDWERRGISHLAQSGVWPKKWPEDMVRQGFSCISCPNQFLLLQVTP